MIQKEKITPTQAVYSIVLFNFGSSVVMGINTNVEQDAWLAILAATLISIPLFLMYARILTAFPEKNVFEISETLFGKTAGKVITVLLVWYAIQLASIVLRDFSEFTEIASMPETPQLPIMILMVLTTIYLARSGMNAVGKWSVITFFFVISVVLLTFGAAINKMDFSDILPFMEHSPKQMAQSAFQIFSFPYAETVLFLCVGNAFQKGNNHYKMFLVGIACILTVFFLVFFRNLTLLGHQMMGISFFPSYVTARIISLGDFLARIESAISSNFLLAGIVKISVCLLAAAKGLASLFNLKSCRSMVLPAGMLALALCPILHANTMDMFRFVEYYPYYAFPFQVIIPLIIFVAGEIHNRKRKAIRQAAEG